MALDGYAGIATRAAAQISMLLEAALRVGAASAEDLFGNDGEGPGGDRGTEPHTARLLELAARLFPQVQDPVLVRDERVIRCVAVDRNGRAPVRNSVRTRHRCTRGGRSVATTEIAAPIVVGRRRWGELRLAFVA